MARNIYFSDKVSSEQNLYEDLIIESLKIYGQDVYYIPRTVVNEDSILGDDIPSKFSSAHKVEMYIENVDGFAGEGDLFQKFGIEIRDQATFIVSRRRWSQTVANHNNSIEGDLPFQGDLIYLPLSKSLFQIMHVERESPFYQLSNLNIVRLECELFEYNDEDMDTGVAEIDAVETFGYKQLLKVSPVGNAVPQVGETITQTQSDGVSISAEVLDWDAKNEIITVTHIGASDGKYREFTDDPLSTEEFADAWDVIEVMEDLGNNNAQNEVFDNEVEDYLVFDEDNPFGDPS